MLDREAPSLAPDATVDGPEVGGHVWPCHGPRDVMDVDVPSEWSLLGSITRRWVLPLLGRGYGDGNAL